MFTAGLAIAGLAFTGAVFDGADMSPNFQTGITEVRAVSDSGIEVFVPVFSLPHCEEEDGTGDPCVWIAHQRGNFIGQSFIQLGTEENRIFADVSPWAAEILVSDGRGVEVPVQAVEPIAEPIAPVSEVEPVQAIHPVQEPEEWAGAECDAQCEKDMETETVNEDKEIALLECVNALTEADYVSLENMGMDADEFCKL